MTTKYLRLSAIGALALAVSGCGPAVFQSEPTAADVESAARAAPAAPAPAPLAAPAVPAAETNPFAHQPSGVSRAQDRDPSSSGGGGGGGRSSGPSDRDEDDGWG